MNQLAALWGTRSVFARLFYHPEEHCVECERRREAHEKRDEHERVASSPKARKCATGTINSTPPIKYFTIDG
jgi:hypothetical protein